MSRSLWGHRPDILRRVLTEHVNTGPLGRINYPRVWDLSIPTSLRKTVPQSLRYGTSLEPIDQGERIPSLYLLLHLSVTPLLVQILWEDFSLVARTVD